MDAIVVPEIREMRELDESQKRAAVLGALLLSHQSSHQRAVRLTAAPYQA